MPHTTDEKEVRAALEQRKQRSALIAGIPEEQLPMDFHIYQIRRGGTIDVCIDFKWEIFQVSYSGNRKKVMKELRKISRRLHVYYGVMQDDIKNRSERYTSLLMVLAGN